jgi:leader peptidase (prepilin peptidase)/N-methyltransferase
MSHTRAQLVLTVVMAGVFGLLIGSFLNVVIYRVPRGLSVVRPGSHCPTCGTPIAPRDNVPVVSWLALGGRCRSCRSPISPRYPLVEGTTAVVFAGLAWALGPVGALVALLVLAAAVEVAAAIDLDGLAVPGPVLGAQALGAAGLLVAAVGALATAVAAAAVCRWPGVRRPEDPGRLATAAAVGWAAGWLWPWAVPVAAGGLAVLASVAGVVVGGGGRRWVVVAAAVAGLAAALAGAAAGGP